GQMGRWYGLVCEEIGRTIAESLEQQWAARAPTTPRRRGVIMGLAAIVGGAAVGAPLLSGLLAADDPPRPCPLRTRKLVAPLDPEELPVPGEMAVPDPEPMIDGDIAEPEPPAFEPTPEPDGGIGSPW
ncbi:MAG: hypothetical protein KC619_16100, partial [Myxococcales bacterium]|nr:hypothetical protein [Myxococcales bacterium]